MNNIDLPFWNHMSFISNNPEEVFLVNRRLERIFCARNVSGELSDMKLLSESSVLSEKYIKATWLAGKTKPKTREQSVWSIFLHFSFRISASGFANIKEYRPAKAPSWSASSPDKQVPRHSSMLQLLYVAFD